MKVKFLGVRGSIPAPTGNREYRKKLELILKLFLESGTKDVIRINDFIKSLPDYLRYSFGGDTTCVSVTSKNGKVYILDCGSGIRQLGEELLNGPAGKGKAELHMFITHTHWDHIQGLPFFKPLYIPGNTINFYSPYENLEKRFIKQMEEPFFPAPFNKTGSTKNFILIKEQEAIQLEDGLVVDAYPLTHPGDSFAYRFREGGKTFIFATDTEFTGGMLEKTGSHTDFFLKSDLLVMDSQYTLDESFNKFEWGHTSYTVAVNCGIRWEVENLVLTHHEPSYTDSKLHRIHRYAVEHRNAMNTRKPNIFIAREGMVFIL